MDVTAIMEKTVKNAGGVVCLQKTSPKKSKKILLSMAKISKNDENSSAWRGILNIKHYTLRTAHHTIHQDSPD